MCAHLAISAASEATGAMSGVCAVAVGALAGLIGLKVSFAAPPRAPKKRQPRNGVTERERPRCFCEPLGAEPMSIRSRLPRASVAKGPPGISFHSSEAADHLNCTRVSTGHWCGTGLKKAHLTLRVSLARLFLAIARHGVTGSALEPYTGASRAGVRLKTRDKCGLGQLRLDTDGPGPGERQRRRARELRAGNSASWHLLRDTVTRGRSSLSARHLAFSVALLAQAHQYQV